MSIEILPGTLISSFQLYSILPSPPPRKAPGIEKYGPVDRCCFVIGHFLALLALPKVLFHASKDLVYMEHRTRLRAILR